MKWTLSAPEEVVRDDHGVKLRFMSFFARASVLDSKEIPVANASIEEIVYRDYVDLSMAVASLVTPVTYLGKKAI